MKIEKIVEKKFIEKIKKDKSIVGVILFGSYARKERKFSDIDICLMLKHGNYTNSSLTELRFKYLGFVTEKVDLQIFQQLPLYMRIKVLKEGRFLINKNIREAFNIALSTIKQFELFRPHYYYYLERIANAGS